MNIVCLRSFLVFASIIWATVGMNRISHGQGTHGMLPDPIGLRESQILLQRYAQLRSDQLPILESVHNEYLQKCKVLREGPIKDYLEFMSQTSAEQMGVVPDKTTVDQMYDKSRRVRQRIKEVDDAFFRELRSYFDENQLDGVNRASAYRSRIRSLSGQFSSGFERGESIDDIVWDTALTPEERATMDPALQVYERSIANLFRKRSELSEKSMYDMVEGMVQAGFGDMTEDSMMDPEYAEEFMGAIDEIMQESYVEVAKVQSDICQRNREFIKQIRDLLPVIVAHEVYLKLDVLSHPKEASMLKPSVVHSRLKTIRESKKVTRDEVQDIENISRQWRNQDMNLIRSAFDLNNELNAEYDFMDVSNVDETIAKSRENFRSRCVASTKFYERVRDLLGAEREERILKSTGLKEDEESSIEGLPGLSTDDLRIAEDFIGALDVRQATKESLMPNAMSLEDLDVVINILGLTDEQASIARALFEKYQDDWNAQVVEREKEAVATELWERSEDSGSVPRFDLEAMKRMWANLYAIHAVSKKIDEQLFVDIESLLEYEDREVKMQAARQFRRFSRIETPQSREHAFGFMLGDSIRIPNPYRLPMEYEEDPRLMNGLFESLINVRDDFEPALSGYERAQLDASYAKALARAKMYSSQAEDELQPGVMVATWQQDYESMLQTDIQELQDQLNRARSVENTTLKALGQHLDADQLLLQKVQILDAILGKSGEIYRLLRKIDVMSDLSDQQKEDILGLIQLHLQFEESHSKAWLDVLAIGSDQFQDFADALAWMEKIEEIKGKRRFDREEYQDRLMIRLSMLLTPIQRARVPALVNTGVELVE